VTVPSKNSYHNSFSKWGKIRCGVPQGYILGPLLFFFYINDLTKIDGNNSKPILFADDSSLIATYSNHTDFNKEITSLFIQLNEWFPVNLLSLNLKKNSIYAVDDKKHVCV
jgi:hypothetical protein